MQEPHDSQRVCVTPDRLFSPLYNPFGEFSEHRAHLIEQLPQGLSKMRRNSFRLCRNFARSCRRVFCSLSTLLEADTIALHEGGGATQEEVARVMRGVRHGFWLGLWGIDKTAAVFDKEQAAFYAGPEADWWRDYRTDWLTERFEPWCVYLSEPDPQNEALGWFVSFELAAGSLALCCQEQRRNNWFDPLRYHEFVWEPGLTLGEAADGYAFSHALSDDLVRLHRRLAKMDTDREASRDLAARGRATAQRLFPLLTAYLSEDFPRQSYMADVVSNVYSAADGNLKASRGKRWNLEAVRRAIEASQGLIVDVCEPVRGRPEQLN